MTLRDFLQRLQRLDLDSTIVAVLATQARAVALAGDHTGLTKGEVLLEGEEARVRWHSTAIRRQGVGEAGRPPEAVLADVAATHGAAAAAAVGVAVADAFRGT